MKKSLLFTALTLASSQAFAVVNGTAIDWSNHDNIVRLDSQILNKQGQCTGTLISGKYVLTAAHCLINEGDVDTVFNVNAIDYPIIFQNNKLHPNYKISDNLDTEDVAFTRLDTQVPYKNIQFLKDLTTPTFKKDEKIKIAGFGGTINTLNYANVILTQTHWVDAFDLYSEYVDESNTIGGDSGSSWVDSNNEIIAIHYGKASNATGNYDVPHGTDLHFASDFILDTVNGWHYPTIAKANGQTTITVQSLHQTMMHPDPSNEAWADGDVTLNSELSTCLTTDIKPYSKCTFVIDSNGGEGVLWLSADEPIEINPKTITNPDEGNGGNGSTGGSSSGGSFGLFSLLALAGLGVIRRKWTN